MIAIDDRQKTLEIVQLAQRHFPNLKILARAFDVVHYHELQDLGVDYIEREMFMGSLNMGIRALQELGMPADVAKRKAEVFAKYDEETTRRLSEHREDHKRFVSESRLAQNEMMRLLQEDNLERKAHESEG